MTSVTPALSIRDAATAAAAAVARSLPIPVTVAAPLSEGLAEDLLPTADGGRAISLNVRGAITGTLVVVLADTLAGALENSPFGAQDLLPALEPALTDAGGALEQFYGQSLQLEAAYEVQPDVALAGLADGRAFAAVTMDSAGEHIATLTLMLDPAAALTAGVPEQRTADPRTHEFQALPGTVPGARTARSLELLHDVEMGVTAELGRTRMTVQDLLSLTPGSVIELDRAAGSPVDVLVNGTLIARGEVVVIDEEFGIRISEIVSTPAGTTARR